MNKNYLFGSAFVAILLLFMASCEYAWITYPEPVPPDPTDTIFFSTKIVPIFTSGDNCTSCHKTGGTPPDLTEANAYNSIIDGNLVDLETPANSIIYDYPSPQSSSHSWKKYTVDESNLVLGWISQGALDN